MPVDIQRPKVALIGRPNVGKSTLFNRLIGSSGRRGGRSAIVDELSGVTRDRLYGVCEWDGYEFTVIDCGGIGPESEDPLWEPVAENSRVAMAEADLILFVSDARTGLTLSDEAVLKELRRQQRPVVVVVNKVDSVKQEADAAEFWSMGYADLMNIAALSGRNVGELLDLIIKKLDWTDFPEAIPANMPARIAAAEEKGRRRFSPRPLSEAAEAAAEAVAGDDYPFAWTDLPTESFVPDESWRDEPVRLVFVGRQNVGKSSLTNALLGEYRALVADLPGTTRDPTFAEFEHRGQRFEVLDTAGMKRISRLQQDVDYYALVRAEKGLASSEVALLTLDASLALTEQDKRVAKKIETEKRAIVIIANKADLLYIPDPDMPEHVVATAQPGPGRTWKGPGPQPEVREAYTTYLRQLLRKLPWAEIIFTSAPQNFGLTELLDAAVRARENFHRRIDNTALQAVLREAITLSPPPVVKNRELRFFDFRQIGNCPPAFLIELSDKMLLRGSYLRYLLKNIRRHFDFRGTHIQLVVYEKRKGQ